MKKILLLFLILATFVVSCGNGGKNSNANTEVQKSEKNSKEIDNSFDFEIYGETLEEAHKNFKTKIVDGQKTEFVPDGKPGIPPKNSKFSLVNYPTKLGEMPMYITAKENNGKKYPAIIY